MQSRSQNKKTAVLLASLICAAAFSACTSPDGRFAAIAVNESHKTLRFVVDNGLGSAMRVQAGIFADNVKTLSDGTLTINVVSGSPAARTAAGGGADLVMLENSAMVAADSTFSTFSMPFFYDNPAHMSAALNSEQMLRILGDMLEAHGITPLAAFYNGSRFFLSEETEISSSADFDGRAMALRGETSDNTAVLTALGAQVAELPAGAGMPALGAEIELPDGEIMTVDAVETTAARAESLLMSGGGQMYFSESYHSLSPLWLIGNTKVLASLSERERAAISESLAGLLPRVEARAIRRESEAIKRLQKKGVVTVGIDRPQIAEVIYDAAQGGYDPPPGFNFRIYEIISSFSQ